MQGSTTAVCEARRAQLVTNVFDQSAAQIDLACDGALNLRSASPLSCNQVQRKVYEFIFLNSDSDVADASRFQCRGNLIYLPSCSQVVIDLIIQFMTPPPFDVALPTPPSIQPTLEPSNRPTSAPISHAPSSVPTPSPVMPPTRAPTADATCPLPSCGDDSSQHLVSCTQPADGDGQCNSRLSAPSGLCDRIVRGIAINARLGTESLSCDAGNQEVSQIRATEECTGVLSPFRTKILMCLLDGGMSPNDAGNILLNGVGCSNDGSEHIVLSGCNCAALSCIRAAAAAGLSLTTTVPPPTTPPSSTQPPPPTTLPPTTRPPTTPPPTTPPPTARPLTARPTSDLTFEPTAVPPPTTPRPTAVPTPEPTPEPTIYVETTPNTVDYPSQGGFAVTSYQRAALPGFNDIRSLPNPFRVGEYFAINGYSELRTSSRRFEYPVLYLAAHSYNEGAPITFLEVVADGLPPGMELDAATGQISGHPSEVGQYVVSLCTAQRADAPGGPEGASLTGILEEECALIEHIYIQVYLTFMDLDEDSPLCHSDDECAHHDNTDFDYSWGADYPFTLSSQSYQLWREMTPTGTGNFGENSCTVWGENYRAYSSSYSGYYYHTQYIRVGGTCTVRRPNCQRRCCNHRRVRMLLRPGFGSGYTGYRTSPVTLPSGYGPRVGTTWPGDSSDWFSPCAWCGGPEPGNGCVRCIQGWGKDEAGNCTPCYNQVGMTIDTHGFCVPCACTPGSYVASGCDGLGEYYDALGIVTATNFLQNSRRLSGSPMVCARCKQGCAAPSELASRFVHRCDPSGFLDNICTPCATCPEGQYGSGCDPADAVRGDVDCQVCSNCHGEQYQTAECTASSDRACVNASLPCDPLTEYESMPVMISSDRVCRPYLHICQPQLEYESAARSSSTDRACSECSSCSDNHFRATECGGDTDTVCERHSEPCQWDLVDGRLQNFYEVSPPTVTSDRVCEQTSTCPLGTYIMALRTNTSDVVCAECSICGEGSYIEEPCSSRGSDAVCAPCTQYCGAGQHRVGTCASNDTDNFDCVACANLDCPDGMHRVGACGRTRDGSYINEFECAPCTAPSDCTAEEYLDGPCGRQEIAAGTSGGAGANGEIEAEVVFSPATANPECRPCANTNCPAFTFRFGTCTSDNNAFECRGCPLFCESGEYLFEDLAGSPPSCECRPCVSACDQRPGTFNPHGDRCGWYSEQRMCRECSTCPAGTWASNTCGGHEDTICEPCSRGRCPTGQWLTDLTNCDTDAMDGVSGESVGGINPTRGVPETFCLPCSTCPSGYYKSEDCTFDRDTHCEACTLGCGAGEYLDGECNQRGENVTTAATRPVCRPCPPRHYWSGRTSGGFDVQCPRCVPVEDCTATGWYLSGECTVDSSGECERCDSCPPGTYVQYPCGGRQQTGCRACPRGMFTNHSDAEACRPHTITTCPNDRFAFTPSITTDGICISTSTPSVAPTPATPAPSSSPSLAPSVAVGCPPGHHLLQTTGPSEHAVCPACEFGKFQPAAEFVGLECAWWTACGVGAYGVGGTALTNVVCEVCEPGSYQPLTNAWVPVESCTPISGTCETGFFMSEPSSPSADRVCSACSACSVEAGEYMVSSCSETADTLCEAITRCPQLDPEGRPLFELAPATGSSNTVCALATDCGVDEFELAPPTGRSDRNCHPCRECSSGVAELTRCTASSDRVCAARCDPGYFQAEDGSSGSDGSDGSGSYGALSCARCGDAVWTMQPGASCGKLRPCSFHHSVQLAGWGVAAF